MKFALWLLLLASLGLTLAEYRAGKSAPAGIETGQPQVMDDGHGVPTPRP